MCRAHFLGSSPSRGVHHDFAGLWNHRKILPTFARKPLFGATSMNRRHRPRSVCPHRLGSYMCLRTAARRRGHVRHDVHMLIAGAHGREVVQLAATLWSLVFTVVETPNCCLRLSFLFVFTIGGFSGVIASRSFRWISSTTRKYFVVAHFHYVRWPGAISPSWERCTTGSRNGPAPCTTWPWQVEFRAVEIFGRSILSAAILRVGRDARRNTITT